MGATPVDYAKIEKLAELLRKHGLEELQIEDESGKISLKMPSISMPASMPQFAMQAPVYHAPQAHQHIAAASAAPINSAEAAKPASKGKILKSPFVGTFYRSSSPGAEPLVAVGQRIKKGQPLCIVEAMKLMNEIESELEGVIIEILVENEQPVEYDQPLFVIE